MFMNIVDLCEYDEKNGNDNEFWNGLKNLKMGATKP